MRLKLDKRGRVLLPKTFRVCYGVDPGEELEVIENAGEFVLRPVRSSPIMVNHDGIWVHHGVPHRKLEIVKAIRESRERILV
jgi:AbrB family looped-hinge helix DNA binding protein